MWTTPQFPADLVTFTGKIINGKLNFLCSVLSCENYEVLKNIYFAGYLWTAASIRSANWIKNSHLNDLSEEGICYWILKVIFFWKGFSCDLEYKKLIFLFKNLYMAIKVLNDFVNKFVCMFVCNGTFLLQILEWFEFQRFLQTFDLDITFQFSPHLTKATSLLKTTLNLK